MGIFILIYIIALAVVSFIWTSRLAEERGLDGTAWGLAALLFGPFAMLAVGLRGTAAQITPVATPATGGKLRTTPSMKRDLPVEAGIDYNAIGGVLLILGFLAFVVWAMNTNGVF